jgi:hypothetical protein
VRGSDQWRIVPELTPGDAEPHPGGRVS